MSAPRRRGALLLVAAWVAAGSGCTKLAGGDATGVPPPPSAPPPATAFRVPTAVPRRSPPPSRAPSPAPSAPVSKASFVREANAICATMNARMNQEQGALPAPTTAAQILQDLEQAITITQGALAKLRELPEPAGDTATLAGLFSKVDAYVASAEQELADLRAAKSAQAAALDAQTTQLNQAANQAFNAYGLTVCGKG